MCPQKTICLMGDTSASHFVAKAGKGLGKLRLMVELLHTSLVPSCPIASPLLDAKVRQFLLAPGFSEGMQNVTGPPTVATQDTNGEIARDRGGDKVVGSN
jgi:hypothetical protein